jgi:hypothetical protein
MNVGIFGGGSPFANPFGRCSQTDVVLPPANQGASGGSSVEVSLSPQAASMLTIDMNSLAAKGYTEVNIDTDGRPGAEISIKVQPGAGTVAVGTQAIGADLRALLENKQADFADLLLALLQFMAQAAQDGSGETDSMLEMLMQRLLGNNENPALPAPESATDATNAAPSDAAAQPA